MLLQQQYHIANADPFTKLGPVIASSPWACAALATATVTIELSFWLSVFSARLRALLVPSAMLMHIGIRALMGPTFGPYLLCAVFWVPWDRVGARVATWRRSSPRYVVGYDGSCGLCRRTISVIRALDVFGRVSSVDVSTDWHAVAARFPGANQDACLETMHIFRADGSAATGFDGYRWLARALPLAWPILPFLYVPGVPQIGRRIYAVVAARRDPACLLPADRTTALRS
jgi:predicted DCC family thiol-disulfide oxidoreductase YuxK